jgi:hypothetical protein
MQVPCANLWPSDDPNENFVHWSLIAQQLGAPKVLSRPFLLGLRGAAVGDAVTHQPVHKPAYDDTFVLLIGEEAPVVFLGATHAYQLDSKLSPDVSGDQRGDVGSIRTGSYLLTDKGAQPHPIFTLTCLDGSDKIPAHRDTDHDGVISEAEAAKSEAARTGPQTSEIGHYAMSVLMHTGIDAPANAVHKFSIACQTTSLKWLELMRTKAAATGGVIDYVLVNAWEAVKLVPAAPAKDTLNV